MGLLPPAVRKLLGAGLLNQVGVGVSLPIGFLFVRDVLHTPVSLASLLVPITAAAATVSHLVVGHVADRFGALRATAWTSAVSVLGAVFYATATSFPAVCAGAAVTGLGIGASTGWFALLAKATSPPSRQFVFGVNQVSVNIGVSAGLIISGVVSSMAHADAYRVLFALKAAAHILLILVMVSLRRALDSAPVEAHVAHHDGRPAAGARLRQRLFGLAAINFVLVAFGMSQLDSAVIAGIVSQDDFPSWVVALALGVNTCMVVAFNVMFGTRLSAIRAERLLLATAPVWAISWVVFGLCLALPSTTVAITAIMLSLVIFSFGEVLAALGLPGLTTASVDDAFVGRAFGLQNTAGSIGFIIGPLATSGLLAGWGPAAPFIVFAAALQIVPLAVRYAGLPEPQKVSVKA